MLISLQSTMENQARIFDGSRFTLNRRMDNGVRYWRCAKRTCPARITTEGNDCCGSRLLATLSTVMGLNHSESIPTCGSTICKKWSPYKVTRVFSKPILYKKKRPKNVAHSAALQLASRPQQLPSNTATLNYQNQLEARSKGQISCSTYQHNDIKVMFFW